MTLPDCAVARPWLWTRLVIASAAIAATISAVAVVVRVGTPDVVTVCASFETTSICILRGISDRPVPANESRAREQCRRLIGATVRAQPRVENHPDVLQTTC